MYTCCLYICWHRWFFVCRVGWSGGARCCREGAKAKWSSRRRRGQYLMRVKSSPNHGTHTFSCERFFPSSFGRSHTTQIHIHTNTRTQRAHKPRRSESEMKFAPQKRWAIVAFFSIHAHPHTRLHPQHSRMYVQAIAFVFYHANKAAQLHALTFALARGDMHTTLAQLHAFTHKALSFFNETCFYRLLSLIMLISVAKKN